MQSAKLQTIRLLNGLAQINKERAAGYNKTLALLPVNNGFEFPNFETLLSDFLRDSKLFAKTLENIVIIEGGKMPYGLKVDQYLYELARQLKTSFSNLNSNNFLSIVKRCESIIHTAYDFVLNEPRLAIDPKNMVAKQKSELHKSEDFIAAINTEVKATNVPEIKGVVVQMNDLLTTDNLMSEVV